MNARRFTPDMTFGPFEVSYFVGQYGSPERRRVTTKVTVAIDPVGLADLLGPRAASSVRGVSHEAGGRVRVKVAK